MFSFLVLNISAHQSRDTCLLCQLCYFCCFDCYQGSFLVFKINSSVTVERFSNECRKTKTKVIILTNHNEDKTQNEPIRNQSKHNITFDTQLKTAL